MRKTPIDSEGTEAASPPGKEELKASEAKREAPLDHPASSKKVPEKEPVKSLDQDTTNPKKANKV